jgi:predicted MFS family arabinose efflux permease
LRFRDFSATQWTVLVILVLINFVNYVDRQIIFSLFPALRAEFHLSHKQLGTLASAFTVILAIASLPLGMLADRVSRRMIISAGVIFWSAATFVSGLANSYYTLLVARGLVGIGEASYTPAGTAVITATFSKQIRARVQGIFDTGMFVGGAAGIVLGGIIAQWLGWRAAFFIVGVPGLILGLSGLKLPEPPKSARQEQEARLPLRDLVRVPAYLMVLASAWFSSFAGYTYVAWGPEFVQEYKGFTPSQSGLSLGVTVLVAGSMGILVGASISDRLAHLWAWGRAAIVPLGFVIAAPLIFMAVHSAGMFHFILFFGIGTFFLSWYHGPVTATIHDIIPSKGHATAFGLYFLFINLFAMALAPVLIGAIADRAGLVTALHTAIASQLIGGVLFAFVPYLIRRDGVHHPALNRYWAAEIPAAADSSGDDKTLGLNSLPGM